LNKQLASLAHLSEHGDGTKGQQALPTQPFRRPTIAHKLYQTYETYLTQLADLTARRQGWRTSTDRIPRKVRACYRSCIKNSKDFHERFLLVFVLIYFNAIYDLDVPEALMKDMEDRGWSKNGWATCWGCGMGADANAIKFRTTRSETFHSQETLVCSYRQQYCSFSLSEKKRKSTSRAA